MQAHHRFLLLSLAFCLATASIIIIGEEYMGYKSLDRLLFLLLTPVFYAAVRYENRTYLPIVLIVFIVVIATTWLTESTMHFYKSTKTTLWSLLVIGCACEFVYRNLTYRRQVDRERLELIANLEQALNDIKTLRRLLPICSSCKKIRNDKGYWEQIESYFHEHSDVTFSHGICPDCFHKLYPGIEIKHKENT
jgi:hypothetical protein